MSDYKKFHMKSSLTINNADEFSKITSWVSSMKNFSPSLRFEITNKKINLRKKLLTLILKKYI